MGFRQKDFIIGFNRKQSIDLEDLSQHFNQYTVRSIQIHRDGDILEIWLD